MEKPQKQSSETMEWVTHPARENPKALIFALSVICAAGIAVAVTIGSSGVSIGASAGWGTAAAAFLIFSLRNFFFPNRITLDDKGITLREAVYTRRRVWSECKSLHTDKNGVLVSPFAFTTRLENYRGLYLRFAGNRAQVLEFLKARINKGEGGGDE